MTEALTDPKTAHSDEPAHTAFNRAFNTTDNYWTWVGQPGNEYRNTRFIVGMSGVSKLDRDENILQGGHIAAVLQHITNEDARLPLGHGARWR